MDGNQCPLVSPTSLTQLDSQGNTDNAVIDETISLPGMLAAGHSEHATVKDSSTSQQDGDAGGKTVQLSTEDSSYEEFVNSVLYTTQQELGQDACAVNPMYSEAQTGSHGDIQLDQSEASSLLLQLSQETAATNSAGEVPAAAVFGDSPRLITLTPQEQQVVLCGQQTVSLLAASTNIILLQDNLVQGPLLTSADSSSAVQTSVNVDPSPKSAAVTTATADTSSSHYSLPAEPNSCGTSSDKDSPVRLPPQTSPNPISFQVMGDNGSMRNVVIIPQEAAPGSIQEPQQTESTATNVGSHKATKRFQCDLCQASFTTLGNYTRHRMVHVVDTKGDFRYKCELCERPFLQKCDLRRHMHIHNQTHPYKCDACGKGFIRKSDLVVHMRFHMKEKPYKCHYCEKSFYQSGDLKRHERTIHQKLKHLVCGHCNNKYTTENTLIRHMQRIHKDLLVESVEEPSASEKN